MSNAAVPRICFQLSNLHQDEQHWKIIVHEFRALQKYLRLRKGKLLESLLTLGMVLTVWVLTVVFSSIVVFSSKYELST